MGGDDRAMQEATGPSRVNPVYPFRKPADLDGHERHYPVCVVGAGPVGLAAAIDLKLRGVDVLLVDEDDTVSAGSRLICLAKRTLEILARLGIGPELAAKGVVWNRGKVFHGDELVYAFDLLPEEGHRWPAFINIQQYYVEEYLVDRARSLDLDLRWKTRLAGTEDLGDGVRARVSTPAGGYSFTCEWLLACDGVRSTVRDGLGLPFRGRSFPDRFLIADVRMKSAFPAERRFWFDPPFHAGRSALLHKQPDDIWRIDLQLGPDADPDKEARPERVLPRIRAMIGPDTPFDLEWVSVYTFRCRRLERFRHGRIFFLGDAAHQVSPFGARGGNGGIQDADNLAWKLAETIGGRAGPALLDSYEAERIPAADENILNSARSTDFMTPVGGAAEAFRDAALSLSRRHAFARSFVNSGRLSTPALLAGSPLSTPDCADFEGSMRQGAAAADAPFGDGWWLDRLDGGFALLHFTGRDGQPPACPGEAALHCARPDGLLAARYDGRPGTTWLFRPDQHVAARWRSFDAARIGAAVDRARGRS